MTKKRLKLRNVIAAIAIFLAASLSFVSCKKNDDKIEEGTLKVNGVSFKMVAVYGGTFTMGATEEQSGFVMSRESPPHQVTLSDFYP